MREEYSTLFRTKEDIRLDPWILEVELLNYKPLSANKMYTMRRKPSWDYTKYKKAWEPILSMHGQPSDIDDDLWKKLEFKIELNVGVSNKAQDLDNTIKPIQDILQNNIGFNDKQIYEIEAYKHLVPKGQEYMKVRLTTIERKTI